MKITSLIILAITLLFGSASSQILLDDFESNRLLDPIFMDGVLTAPFANPTPNAVNSSTMCGKYVRNAGAPFDVIVYALTAGGFFNADDVVDIAAGTKSMTMDVLSPAPGKTVTISLENAAIAAMGFPGGRHSQYVATTTTTNAWETLTFSLSTTPDATTDPAAIDQLVVLFNSGTLSGDTYYFDNIMGPDTTNPCSGTTPDLNIFEDFECQRNATKSFSHGVLAVASNPDASGINTSSNVGCYTRADFIEFDVIVYDFPAALDLTVENQVKLKVWSPNASTEVRIAFQNASNGDVYAASLFTSVVNQWEELTWDLSSVSSSTTVVKAVILFAPGTFLGTTYYLDDFKLEGFTVDPCIGVTPSADTLENFECQQNITYTFAEGSLATVANPTPDATNSSSDVGQYIRNGAITDAWGGPLNLGPLNFTTNNQLKMHFLNNHAPVGVSVVFQNSSNVDLASITTTSAGTGAWETLSFDFSGISAASDISNIVLLIGAGDSLLGGNTYYYDNMVVSPQPTCLNSAPQNPTSNAGFTNVTLSWGAVVNATGYQIKGGPVGNINAATLNLTNTSITVNNLNPGCYEWYVRAKCAPNVFGPWSAINTFCMATCMTPAPTLSTVTGNSVVLSWTQSPGALGYIIKGGPGTSSSAVTLQINNGAQTSLTVNNLNSGTYSWRIMAVCSVNPYIASPFTAFNIFAIPSATEKAAIGGDFTSVTDMNLKVYPNPASDQLMVRISNTGVDQSVELRLIDITGQTIIQRAVSGSNQVQQIDVSAVAAGVYHLQLIGEGTMKIEKVIINK